MNYRHLYHAGNFADVFKHVVLLRLLRALLVKDQPLCYLETHAGAGRYDLSSPVARKSAEARAGVQRLSTAAQDPALEDYLALVRAAGGGRGGRSTGMPRFYPGSPLIAAKTLRRGDRMVLFESDDAEAGRLQRSLRGRTKTQIILGDGLLGLRAQLPPAERRGLVFIDPPYEQTAEWSRVIDTLGQALTRWASGRYALWYPIKQAQQEERLLKAVIGLGIKDALTIRFTLDRAASPARMKACGILLINPPWGMVKALDGPLLALCAALAPTGGARHDVQCLGQAGGKAARGGRE